MKQEYYNADVKAYDPMGRHPMDGIGAVINNEDLLYEAYSRKCLDYNPIGTKSDFYQPGYKVQLFNKISNHPEKVFKQKEWKVMKYESKEIRNQTSIHFSFSERMFNGGSLFARIFKRIITTVHRWYQIFNKPNK